MKKHTLLIIDSEPDSLLTLVKHVSGHYCPVVAESGQAAWQHLCTSPSSFSAIVLDQALPDMEGLDLLHHIKQDPHLRNLPVIMIAKQAQKNTMISGFKKGIYDFLVKPIDKDLLNLVLKRALRESSCLGGVVNSLA
ncbi:MAG: response regulator [Gammaproteobacteria bacterium]|nr:response regulator [Gammaproteobacteria bacterium]